MQPAIHCFGETQKLWIIRTDRGIKRTWKPTKHAARQAASRNRLQVLSIRPATDRDLQA